MIEIREIGADELERWIGVAGRVRDDRGGGASEYVDWKRQAEDMVWLVAIERRRGCRRRARLRRLALEAGRRVTARCLCRKSTAVRRRLGALRAGRGVGAGARRVTLERSVAEDDPESLAWVDRRGFREVGGTRGWCST